MLWLAVGLSVGFGAGWGVFWFTKRQIQVVVIITNKRIDEGVEIGAAVEIER